MISEYNLEAIRLNKLRDDDNNKVKLITLTEE